MNTENPQPCRTQKLLILLSILMVTAGFGWFMLGQLFMISGQSSQADFIVTEYRTNGLPAINKFVDNLRTFARTNPDFNPILARYNLLSAPPAAPVAPKK